MEITAGASEGMGRLWVKALQTWGYATRERENESKRERERERERVRERDGDTLLGGKPRVYISRAIYIYIYSPPCAWRPCVGRFRGATLPGPRLGECF